jgi:hypothetical protein
MRGKFVSRGVTGEFSFEIGQATITVSLTTPSPFSSL